MTRAGKERLPTLAVAIFSYNRGRYLRNCVDSVRENLPFAEVTIYDDRSDDPETITYLAHCDVQVKVNESVSTERHGNLYRNMQRAVDECRADYLLFLQDYTQVVRPLDEETFSTISSEMAEPNRAFMRTLFLWGRGEEQLRRLLSPGSTRRVYNVDPRSPDCGPFEYYVDLSLCVPDRLRQSGWKFASTEPGNARQARALFGPMPVLADPFVFQCPEVPAFRDRRLFLASSLVQARREGAIVRFEPMKEEKIALFKHRPLSDLPVAERWLVPNLDDVRQPFVHTDYSRTWWLTALYKVESRLWRMWKPFRRLMRR